MIHFFHIQGIAAGRSAICLTHWNGDTHCWLWNQPSPDLSTLFNLIHRGWKLYHRARASRVNRLWIETYGLVWRKLLSFAPMDLAVQIIGQVEEVLISRAKHQPNRWKRFCAGVGVEWGRSNRIFFFLIEIENYIIDKKLKQKGHNLRACQIYKSKETVIVYQTWLGAGYAILMSLTHGER